MSIDIGHIVKKLCNRQCFLVSHPQQTRMLLWRM